LRSPFVFLAVADRSSEPAEQPRGVVIRDGRHCDGPTVSPTPLSKLVILAEPVFLASMPLPGSHHGDRRVTHPSKLPPSRIGRVGKHSDGCPGIHFPAAFLATVVNVNFLPDSAVTSLRCNLYTSWAPQTCPRDRAIVKMAHPQPSARAQVKARKYFLSVRYFRTHRCRKQCQLRAAPI